MLLQLREFIQRERVVSVQQLTRAFHVDEQALQPMLELWIRRGVIDLYQEQTACQSACFRCKSVAPTYYSARAVNSTNVG